MYRAPRKAGSGLYVVLVIVLLVGGAVAIGSLNIKPFIPGSITSPSSVDIFDAAGFRAQFKGEVGQTYSPAQPMSQILTGATAVSNNAGLPTRQFWPGSICDIINGKPSPGGIIYDCPNPYIIRDTSFYIPSTVSTYDFVITDGTNANLGTFGVQVPADAPKHCMGSIQSYGSIYCWPTYSYGVSGSISGYAQLYQGASACSQAVFAPDCASVNANLDPSCGCYRITQTFKGAPVVNSTGTYVPLTIATWYVYREILSVHLQTDPSISVTCLLYLGSCTTSQYAVCLWLLGCYGDRDSALRAGIGNALNIINANAQLTGTKIALQLNIPAGFINANTNKYWIAGAWVGGAGPISSTATCGPPATCKIVQTSHSSLGIYSDPSLVTGITPVFSQFPNISQYNSTQLANLLPATSAPTVYTSFDIASFGAGFTLNPTCSVTNLQTTNCFTTSSVSIDVPIVYDILGSYTTFGVQYTPPVPTGKTTADVYIQVVDGSSILCNKLPGLYSSCAPIAGASVNLGGPPSTTGCSTCVSTDSTGTAAYTGLAAPATYVFYVSFAGYSPGSVSVGVTVGSITRVQLAINPAAGAGNICILPAIPNPVPGQAPVFPGLCQPWWLIILELGLVGAIVIVAIVVLAAPARAPALAPVIIRTAAGARGR